MKKSRKYGVFLLSFISVCFAFPAFAQYAGDAFRYSEINQTGTARFQGLGGNHAALGGDASTISGNPAGLGFYNRSEFSISPAVTNMSNTADYINGSSSSNSAHFNIANASLIIASQPSFERKWRRSSFGISYSRQQSFRDAYNYGGLNNKSAYLDKVAQDVNFNRTPVSQLEADFESSTSNGGPLAYSVPAAYYQMYLINPSSSTGPPYTRLDSTSAVNQFGSYNATGANTQWNFAYAGNYNDKLYVGGTFGYSRLRYNYDRSFEDAYVNSSELVSMQQNENLTVTGNGINFSLGIIYKFNPVFQLGGVLTSPTLNWIKETFTQDVSAKYVGNLVSDPNGTLITPPYESLPISANDFQYSLVSPFKGSIGATIFIREKGFLTGSLEYIGYSGMGVKTTYLGDADNRAFKSETKAEIKDLYRNTVNLRIGGEFRANLFRARLGLAYLADPYVDRASLNRDKILFSGGLGYRSKSFFADVAATFGSYKSSYTPYTLNNVEDYSSVAITNKPVNVMLTVGTFF